MARRSWRGERPLRGVNLGNWLVLERWMEPSRPAGPFAGTDADDESSLRRELPADELHRRLERHRSSYLGPDTFSWLADVGCDLVRVPVPYHVFGDGASEACIDWLDRALDWSDREGLRVLVDLHTVPGGQNGFDNSGVSGLCTWHLESRQVSDTLAVLERLARRYTGHPALFGIEPMNEPASKAILRDSLRRYGATHPGRVERSCVIPHHVLAQFYKLAYERLRPILGPRVALVLHDQFSLDAWDRVLPADRYPNVWIDTHQYVGVFARAAHLRTLPAHLACTRVVGARIARAARHHPVLVGEWSLTSNLAGLSGASDESKRTLLSRYGRAQLAAFEQGQGSCFWSLQCRIDTWSLRSALDHGWLDLRQHG